MLTFPMTGNPLNEGDQLFSFVRRFAQEVDRSQKATHTVLFEFPNGDTIRCRVRFVEMVTRQGAPRKGGG